MCVHIPIEVSTAIENDALGRIVAEMQFSVIVEEGIVVAINITNGYRCSGGVDNCQFCALIHFDIAGKIQVANDVPFLLIGYYCGTNCAAYVFDCDGGCGGG